MIWYIDKDKDNKLITMESGSVSVSSLRAGDNSPFTINIHSSKDDVDHYTLFPAGTPRCIRFRVRKGR